MNQLENRGGTEDQEKVTALENYIAARLKEDELFSKINLHPNEETQRIKDELKPELEEARKKVLKLEDMCLKLGLTRDDLDTAVRKATSPKENN